jgi:sulfur transfer protein SufE
MKKEGREIIQDKSSISTKKIKRKKKDAHVLNQFRSINRKRKIEIVPILNRDIKNMANKGKKSQKKIKGCNKNKNK